MTAPLFANAFGRFALARRPVRRDDPLLAWDAADELLLATLHGHGRGGAPVLVINDSFGALAVALAGAVPVVSWGDSVCAHLALADNLARNGIAAPVESLPATDTPAAGFGAVLWRVPKSTALLQQQGAKLSSLIQPGTLVLAAGMDKHLPPQVSSLMQAFGDVERLPGRKKAHVFIVRPSASPSAACDGLPASTFEPVAVTEYGLHLRGDANVFATGVLDRGNIDIGARALIEQFERLPAANRIADLGCGNGLLGILAQRRFPAAQCCFVDESYQAVAVAQANYWANLESDIHPAPVFMAADGLSTYGGPPFDLVLCNPPFHQGHSVDVRIAHQLFRQAWQSLRPGGSLWVVGNRHLDYYAYLRRLFGRCQTVASNRKFTVLAAAKRDERQVIRKSAASTDSSVSGQ